MQLLHDAVDAVEERLSPRRGGAIEGTADVRDVRRRVERAQIQPLRDGLVAGGLLAQEGVELAGRDVVEAVALDVVADIDGIVDPVGDVRPGDVELALEVEVGEAARADPDPGPVELLDTADAAASADDRSARGWRSRAG